MTSSGKERLRGWARELSRTPRLVLAVKTAAAAAVAWYLAPFVPLAESEYSYYAPLGVLVSTYTTVIDSVRAGAQALFGLAVGIALGLGALTAVAAGAPSAAAVALVVAVGVALGGLHVFGAGRDWIPIAGVLVLLLSGHEGRDFSLSYLVTMGFGVLVGLLVQWVAVPPLYFGEARARLADLRGALARCLAAAAGVVRDGEEEGRREDAPLRRSVDALIVTFDDVADEIREARRSERINPRARRRRGERRELDEQFRALDRAAFFVRALADLLSRTPPESLRDPLAGAIAECGRLVSVSGEAEGREQAAGSAREALDRFFLALDGASADDRAELLEVAAVGACLGRIVGALE